MKDKTLLFITYYFPPAGGPSVQRALKFVKYLPEFGWKPIVFTTSENSYPIRDSSLLSDIPTGTQVYKGKSWDINRYQSQFRKFKLGKLHSILNTLLSLPDYAVFWSKFAHPYVDKVISQHKPMLIFSTSGPYSAHLLARWIKNKYHLPWIADFRDPWSQNKIIRYPPGYRWVNKQMETKVLKTADQVVTVSAPNAENLAALIYPYVKKFRVIPNGYDTDDVTAYGYEPTTKFTISYTGKFTRIRRPDAFIEAITILIDKGIIPKSELEVNFAGSNMDPFVPDHEPFYKLGYIPHSELAGLVKRSNVLLLVQDPSPDSIGDYSAKLFEYLATNRPILAITSHESVAAKLIIKANCGVVVEHDVFQIGACIQNFYIQWKNGIIHHNPDWQVIKNFDRRKLTQQLSDIFNELI